VLLIINGLKAQKITKLFSCLAPARDCSENPFARSLEPLLNGKGFVRAKDCSGKPGLASGERPYEKKGVFEKIGGFCASISGASEAA